MSSGNPLEALFVWMFATFHPFAVLTVGTFCLHECMYFGVYVPYVIADRIPAMAKYKIQPDKQNTFSMQWNCFTKLIFVHTLTQIPLMMLSHHFFSLVGISKEPPFPTWTTILSQIVISFIIEDLWFYWFHRLLHWGPFYKYIHKIHHEHTAPFGISAEYAHPIESYILAIGTALGPLFLQAHLLTIWCWMFARVWQTVDVHSGYNFPWSPNRFIPFWGGAEFHDYHHMAFVGNYSSTFTVWDRVFGTDQKYHEWKDKENENKLKAQ